MKWKNSDSIYLYDGGYDSYMTTVYNLLMLKEVPRMIIEEQFYEDSLFDIHIFIENDVDKAKRVRELIGNISEVSLYNVYQALLSGDLNKGIVVYKYILNVIKYKKQIDYMQNKECVVEMRDLCRKVSHEVHKLTGFLRFKEVNAVLYAQMAPDNNVIQYLARHFRSRMPKEEWVIHDKKRRILAWCKNNKINYYEDVDFEFDVDLKEDSFELLWKDYFKNIAIKERQNRRCQLNFMPKKFWKYMLEVKEEL